jgi:D-threo-aldose 1-dehydrogenase
MDQAASIYFCLRARMLDAMLTRPLKITEEHCRPFGRTGLRVPPIVFGTSVLGNAFHAIPDQTKSAIMSEWFRHVSPPVFIDTAGKYGAGMALEVIGGALDRLEISPHEVIINNKLAWKRAPLTGAEPKFEPGVWVNLQHDAELRISYDGILECWEEGCRLLGGRIAPQLASLHDPDEYLAASSSPAERDRRWDDVLGAYQALHELKEAGLVVGIGVGAKDWRTVREIDAAVPLDWVMLANSFTIMNHPAELTAFIASLAERRIAVVNSAVFHAGFLVGGRYFDYRPVNAEDPVGRRLFSWRKLFVALCEGHGISPAHACVQFGLSAPGIVAVALNTSHPDRISENVALVLKRVPDGFWASMKEEGLLAADYPHLG